MIASTTALSRSHDLSRNQGTFFKKAYIWQQNKSAKFMHKPWLGDRTTRKDTDQKHGGQTKNREKIQLQTPTTIIREGRLGVRLASSARKKDGKFSTNWDGPYKVREDIGGGAYRLEQLSGDLIPNTWNVSHLKFYFS